MIKKTIRYTSYVLAFFGLSLLEACKDDEDGDLCYECDGEDYNGDPINQTYCFSDFEDYYTKEEFIDYIEGLNAVGYSCSKK
jgi:hypothetical protein